LIGGNWFCINIDLELVILTSCNLVVYEVSW
jgi:hypothetical protein